MSTKIISHLNAAVRSCDASKQQQLARDIVVAHNNAALYGFLELPLLEFYQLDLSVDKEIAIAVRLRSGMVKLDDLYNMRQAWGADDVEVCEIEGRMTVCIIFNRE